MPVGWINSRVQSLSQRYNFFYFMPMRAKAISNVQVYYQPRTAVIYDRWDIVYKYIVKIIYSCSTYLPVLTYQL